jgi:hypothetical protein
MQVRVRANTRDCESRREADGPRFGAPGTAQSSGLSYLNYSANGIDENTTAIIVLRRE